MKLWRSKSNTHSVRNEPKTRVTTKIALGRSDRHVMGDLTAGGGLTYPQPDRKITRLFHLHKSTSFFIYNSKSLKISDITQHEGYEPIPN